MVRLGDAPAGEEAETLSVETAAVNLDESHDPYFPPVVSLPLVEIPTGEDDEDCLLSMRAKLFRYDHTTDPKEWKERGTGDVKLLEHKETKKIRLLMRRDKTWKVCANHYIEPWMMLKPMMSDRAWMWLSHSDFADEIAKTETFAIRFSSADNALTFKNRFDEAVGKMTILEADKIKEEEEESKKKRAETKTDPPKDSVSDQMSSLKIDGAGEKSE